MALQRIQQNLLKGGEYKLTASGQAGPYGGVFVIFTLPIR